MAGKKPPIANTEPRLGGLRIQTSLYGQTIAVVFGRARIPLNLVWFGGFKATRQEEQSEAAKGGGSRPSRIYYSYSAHVLGLLGEGPITAVRTVYKGKQKFTGQTIAATASSVSVEAAVPAVGPYTVNVGASWTADVGVALTANPEAFPQWDTPLVPGVDYTVAGGVYTFNAAFLNRAVRITYTTTTAASSVDALGQIGLALVPGTPGQATWQLLAQQFTGEALPYSGFAYVRGQDYPLTSAAEVENHGFEVDGFLGATSNGDAWPRDVIREVLTNPNFSGAQWSARRLGDWSSFHAYCQAYNLAISPAFLEQRATRDWLQDMLDSLNTDAAWTGSVLKLIPRGDESAGSYVAPTTPVFDLSADDFLAADGEPPLRLLRSGRSDAHNVVRVEFANRAKDYNLEIQAAEDEAAIITFGRREESAQAWHWFADGVAARQAAFLRLQRKQGARAQWEGSLPWRFAELEPGDLVTLTDPGHYLVRWPVRVLSIEENGDDFDCVFEDFPIGHATAPIVASQLGSGFRPDFNAPPGDVAVPMIFEPPGGFTQNGLEVWAAVSGPSGTPGQYWGGAEVYASLDGGDSYKLIGRVDQGARYGTLSASLAAGSAATMSIALAGRGGQFRSVSAAEADALATLLFIGSPATGEFAAYQSAALTGANAYNLAGLRRGRYGTTDQAAASGTPFVFIDGAVAMSGPLPLEMIGRTISFKFCSFNVFGGGLQQLADVPAYTYTVTGRFRQQAVAAVSANLLKNANLTPNAAGLTPIDFNIPPGSTVIRKDLAAPTVFVPGAPSSVYLEISSGLTGNDRAGGVLWEPISVQAGTRYVFFAGLIGFATDAYVAVRWSQADGTFIRNDFGSVVAGGLLAAANYWNRPENYTTSRLAVVAPANAAIAQLFVSGAGNWAAQPIKFVSIHKPFAGVIPPGVEDLPPWDPGGSNPVDTALLTANAATQRVIPPYNEAGVVFSLATLQFIDLPLGSITAEADGDLSILVNCEVVAQAGTTANTITIGIGANAKRTVISREALTVQNTTRAQNVSLSAFIRDVKKGETIAPILRATRSVFGLGVGNTFDTVRRIECEIKLTKV